MKSLNRIVIALVLLLSTHLLVSWVQAKYEKVEITAHTLDVQGLPNAFSGWEGTSVELDERLFVSIGADSAMNRLYKDPHGEQVAVHLSLWTDGQEWAPHPPRGCYTTAGWDIAKSKKVMLNSAEQIDAQFMTFEREGNSVATLFWYQLGDQIYFDRDGARAARRELWGDQKWPPLVKVLIQTSGLNDARSENRLINIGSHIRNWTATLKPETAE